MTEVAAHNRLAHRVATVVAEVASPVVIVAAITVVIAVASSPTWPAAMLWALVAAGFCSGIPFWVLARGARQGKWDTHHVRGRADRVWPLSVAIGSVIAGLLALLLGGAPQQLIALVTSMLVSLALCTLITTVWKVSLHASISAGAVAVLALAFGPAWWAALAIVALVSWARWLTVDHTVTQVVFGAVAGAVLGGGVFALLA